MSGKKAVTEGVKGIKAASKRLKTMKAANKKRKVESTRPVIKAKATPPSKPTPVKDAALAFTAGAGTVATIANLEKISERKKALGLGFGEVVTDRRIERQLKKPHIKKRYDKYLKNIQNKKNKVKKASGGRVKNRNMGGVIGGGLGSQDVVDYLYKYKS